MQQAHHRPRFSSPLIIPGIDGDSWGDGRNVDGRSLLLAKSHGPSAVAALVDAAGHLYGFPPVCIGLADQQA